MSFSVEVFHNRIIFLGINANAPHSDMQKMLLVVCPLLGHTVRKTVFENTSCLPPEMKSYVNKLQSGDPELFRYTSSFCVQDPFDLSHNLSKAWTSATVNKFKALCNLSVQHLDTL
ncbi:unnamed protein product [Acanthoscelides obtectus]|uniref:Uncharacterized protein n=1 Tax=Acanthoscelides obtectus TaxID=200917 RepID=A0A9P0LD02_ACAOB|nr:unnamed protein product [Acanthoscelides obtectus]CAK1655732.1 hypothetical protein AOBTE_LOCUS19286 [Acanthoscelides obtectus]